MKELNPVNVRCRKDALKYLRFKDMLESIPPEEIKQYQVDTIKAFSYILVHVEYVDYEPYHDLEDLRNMVKATKMLLVSDLNNNSKLLPGVFNLQFRAFHDYLHYVQATTFTYKGELETYELKSKYYSSTIGKRMLYSEVVLQAAYKEYFGEFSKEQKIVI